MSSKVLKDVLNELGRYYGVRSSDTFLNAILGTAKIELWGKTSEDDNPVTKVINAYAGQSDVAISSKGIAALISESFSDAADKKTLAANICITPSSEADDTLPANRHPNVVLEEGDDAGQGVFKPGNKKYYTTGDYIDLEKDDNNNLSIIQIFPAVGNLSNSDSDVVSLFLNSLPTLEISRAVPVMDISVLSNESGEDKHVKNLTIGKFLMGDEIPTEVNPMLNAHDLNSMNDSSGFSSIASMEIFTSPQTMLPIGPNGSLSPYSGQIDPFRPLLSLQSLAINSVGTQGMHSYKSANMSLVLHDRGSLNTVLPLVSPGKLNTTKLQITYGWTHPDGKISYTTGQAIGGRAADASSSDNLYADLINSMRHTEIFNIVNSDFNFKDDGSVSINLSLATAGETSVVTQDITLSSIVDAYSKLKEITDKVKDALRTSAGKRKKFGNITPPRSLMRSTNANSAAFLKPDQIKELRTFIGSAKNKDMKAIGKFITKLYGKTGRSGSAIKTFASSKSAAVKEIIDHFKKTPDPFLAPVGLLETATVTTNSAGRSPKNFENSHDIDSKKRKQKYISLGKVLSYFMKSTMSDESFSEIQMIFYPFNESAGWLFDANIAQFPIPLDDLEAVLTERFKNSGRMSMTQFLQMLNAYFLKDQSMPGYNFVGVYGDRDPDNSRKRKFNGTLYKDRKTKEKPNYQAINDKKEKIIATAYGLEPDDPGANFKPPQVYMKLQTMKMTDNQNGIPDGSRTILRIHVYDKQCSSVSTLSDVLEGFSGDGTLAAQTRKKRAKRGAQHSKVTSYHLSTLSTSPNKLIDKLDDTSTTVASVAKSTGIDEAIVKKLLAGMYAINSETSASKIKDIYSLMFPALVYGSATSGIITAKVASMNNPALSTIRMLGSNPSKRGAASGFDEGLPVVIAPTSLELEVIGCPYIAIGQQYFVDMGTNTTADNFYGVFEVNHNFEAGKFTTSVKLGTMSSFGKWRASSENIKSIVAAAAYVEMNKKST